MKWIRPGVLKLFLLATLTIAFKNLATQTIPLFWPVSSKIFKKSSFLATLKRVATPSLRTAELDRLFNLKTLKKEKLSLHGKWDLRMFMWIQVSLVIRHFGPRILNSQIRSPFSTGKLSFWTIFSVWISEFADKKSSNNEGRLYFESGFMKGKLRLSLSAHVWS